MAETLISPGVLAIETDQSFVSKRPVTVGAAIIGPTVKGPVEIPTVVTTWTQYQNIFGTTFTSGSATNQQTYTYFTSIAAFNYFANGGGLLGEYVVRFQFDWENKKYDMRKCVIGAGSAGEDIGNNLTLPIIKAKTMDSFVSFIKEIIGTEIIKDTFKN